MSGLRLAFKKVLNRLLNQAKMTVVETFYPPTPPKKKLGSSYCTSSTPKNGFHMQTWQVPPYRFVKLAARLSSKDPVTAFYSVHCSQNLL